MPKVVHQGRERVALSLRVLLAVLVCILFLIPLVWMLATAFKDQKDVITVPPRLLFTPSLQGLVNRFTQRSLLSKAAMEEYAQRPDLQWYDRIALAEGQAVIGPSQFVDRVTNSIIIASGSTIFAVVLGVLAAYAFSRFKIAGQADLEFFILSTRMLPPVVVTIPIFLMYRQLGLFDTHLGMIILYTVFNLSLSVWLLKGFIDEIPREYEEAALVDGYSRWQAFTKIVLPQSVTGIAATTVFCMIFAWNEYAFALMLTSERLHGAAQHPFGAGHGRHRVEHHRRWVPAVSDPGGHHHLCATQVSSARHHLWSDSQMTASDPSTPPKAASVRRFRLSRRWLEPASMITMAVGLAMMFQPFALILFTYSFLVILIGTISFIVAVHLSD